MIQRRLGLIQTICSASFLMIMTSQVTGQQANQALLWTSTGKTAKEFSDELGALYLTQFNSQSLPTQPHIVSNDATIEAILRDKGILIGPIFPVELDSVVCELNKHVCERNKQAVSPNDVNSLKRIVRGAGPSDMTAPSKNKWPIIKSGTPLVLPAIRLERTVRWVDTKKEASQPMEQLVVTQLGGCDQLDERCKKDILSRNRKADAGVFEPSFEGSLVLPVIAARSAISEKIVIKELQRNLIGGARIAVPFAQTLIAKDFNAFQTEIGKLISFPYRKLAEFPDHAKKAKVAVFDFWVDQKHCALPAARFQFHNINPDNPPAGPTPANCNSMETPDRERDHGTHVAGLIGAAPEHGLSFGLNPFAKVSTYEISLNDLNDLANLDKLAADLNAVRSGDNETDVVNMSFGYVLRTGDLLQPGLRLRQDPLETAIEGMKEGVLVVAAAGNDGLNKSNICDLRPACFDFPNVISVAALDRSLDKPDLLADGEQKITNYGRQIHIGAVGENVFSTIRFGRYGTMSGTSQAAPQVAAVASLMMSKYPKQTPLEIKNRLIYCSDFVGAFEGKLFGGRLNAECSIDGDHARLRHKNMPASASPLLGKSQVSSLKFTERFSGREIILPTQAIRALHFNPKSETYVAFYSLDGAERDSRLLRESNLVPSADQTLVFISKDGDETFNIRLTDIVKYISSIK